MFLIVLVLLPRVYFSDSVLNFSFVTFFSERSESCLSLILSSSQTKHSFVPRCLVVLLPLFPPVRLRYPRCNHGGDEDEVPLSEKGEAGPGTVAPLLECHSGRSDDLQPGVHPKNRAPQEGRGTFQVLHARTLKLHNDKTLFCLFYFFFTCTVRNYNCLIAVSDM